MLCFSLSSAKRRPRSASFRKPKGWKSKGAKPRDTMKENKFKVKSWLADSVNGKGSTKNEAKSSAVPAGQGQTAHQSA